MSEETRLFCNSAPKLQRAWDSTSLKDLQWCPRRYQYHILEGWRSKMEAAPLRFGIHYHAALERYDKLRAIKVPIWDAAREAVKYCLLEARELDGLGDDARTLHCLVRSVVWYIEHYGRDDVLEPVVLPDGSPAVELSFRFALPLKSPDGEAYLICGHLDKIADTPEGLRVQERKHTKYTLTDKYFSQFSPNLQVSIYHLASQICFALPCEDVLIDACQTTITFSNYGRRIAHRPKAVAEESLREIQLLVKEAELYAEMDFWPRREENCDKYGGCAFKEICSKDPKVRPTWLAGDFKKEFWNPLENR